MGIYLGDVGHIELIRKSLEGSKESIVNPSDVNASRNRFSFDFEEGYLITGDFVELATIDGTGLDFVDASGWANGIVQSSGNWYVHINELGSIKLYNNFSDSLDSTPQGRVPLIAITRDIPIRVTVRSRDARCLASVTEYEINTSRESVDITVLSDEYRQQYSSLISGSGRLTAHWDYAPTTGSETVQYLMQLVLRTEIGSSFHGKFYIKSPNTAPIDGCFDPHHLDDALWWEFDAVVTNSATSFAPGDIVVSTIDFVSTGPIHLRARTMPDRYLLQEDTGKIELEQAANYLVLEESE